MKIDPSQRAYVCKHVFEDTRLVKLVAIEDGDWSFLCGDMHSWDTESCFVVCIGHMFDRDPTLLELQDLPDDWEAEREDIGKPWIRIPICESQE